MDASKGKQTKVLPENAYRKLKEGEVYEPIVPAGDKRAEVSFWSVTMGLLLTVIFTAACIYVALRAGNGIEAAIPIAILAIFFGKMKKIKSTILENVIVQSIGQSAGVVAAGAAFVVPAIYINKMTPDPFAIFFACLIGGTLGVVLIIPLRKYFVKKLHGDLPFPEATAANEILCSGESSGGTAGKVLIISFFIGAIFDFLIEGVHAWPDVINSTNILGAAGEKMVSYGFEIKIFGTAMLFGLGYIIGLKYASIIASGSVLAMLVMVPLIMMFGAHIDTFDYAGASYDISKMDPSAVFGAFIRPIGIGAIAVSGLIGIIRMGKIVGSAISLGFKGLKKDTGDGDVPRTELDMKPKTVLLIQLVSVLAMAALFFIVSLVIDKEPGVAHSVGEAAMFAVVGAFTGFLLSFLFTPVAAQAIAIVGVNPVSGMTLITVVLTIMVLVMFGLKGNGGMMIALIVGTAVCTALSTSGALISDFKIGYWIGATPKNQERWKFLGLLVASLVVAVVIPLMNSSYNFLVPDPANPENMISNTEQLPAPQANMIAAVSKGLLEDPAKQPWLLYGLGAIMAIVLFMGGVPMLAFALGIYLPIGINTAVLFGAFVAFIVSKTGKDERVRKARTEQGTLIASGIMAGAAVFGIITAILRVPEIGSPIQYISVGVKMKIEDGSLANVGKASYFEHYGQQIAFGALLGLAVVAYLLSKWGAKKTIEEENQMSSK